MALSAGSGGPGSASDHLAILVEYGDGAAVVGSLRDVALIVRRLGIGDLRGSFSSSLLIPRHWYFSIFTGGSLSCPIDPTLAFFCSSDELHHPCSAFRSVRSPAAQVLDDGSATWAVLRWSMLINIPFVNLPISYWGQFWKWLWSKFVFCLFRCKCLCIRRDSVAMLDPALAAWDCLSSVPIALPTTFPAMASCGRQTP